MSLSLSTLFRRAPRTVAIAPGETCTKYRDWYIHKIDAGYLWVGGLFPSLAACVADIDAQEASL
jgi:hypothetical protein